MAFLNLTQAAVAVGKNRVTLHRYIKNGKLSCEKSAAGKVVIDTSELIRVFGDLKNSETTKQKDTKQSNEDLLQQLHDATEHIKWLMEKLDEERARASKLEEEKEKEREHSREIEKLMLAAGAQKKPGWFSRLFGS
jgi:predicted site-specific integrase-resolvase